MISNPEFYFAKTFTSSVPGNPRRKYYLSRPDTPDGIDPFKSTKFPYERLGHEDNQRSQSSAAAICQRAKKETTVFS
jgi:hypothetical protein